jgi:hypothetical protein
MTMDARDATALFDRKRSRCGGVNVAIRITGEG